MAFDKNYQDCWPNIRPENKPKTVRKASQSNPKSIPEAPPDKKKIAYKASSTTSHPVCYVDKLPCLNFGCRDFSHRVLADRQTLQKEYNGNINMCMFFVVFSFSYVSVLLWGDRQKQTFHLNFGMFNERGGVVEGGGGLSTSFL